MEESLKYIKEKMKKIDEEAFKCDRDSYDKYLKLTTEYDVLEKLVNELENLRK